MADPRRRCRLASMLAAGFFLGGCPTVPADSAGVADSRTVGDSAEEAPLAVRDGPFEQLCVSSYGGVTEACGLRGDGTVTCWNGEADREAWSDFAGRVARLDEDCAPCLVTDEGGVSCVLDGQAVEGPAGVGDAWRNVAGRYPLFLRAEGGELFRTWEEVSGDWQTGLHYDWSALEPLGTALAFHVSNHTSAYLDAEGRLFAVTRYGVGDADEAPWAEVNGSGPYDRLSVGSGHVCVLAEGAIQCFGDDGALAPLPTGAAFLELATEGVGAGCALAGDGHLTCFGEALAQYGTLTGPFVSVVAGEASFCALSTDGRATCGGAVAAP